MRAIKKYTLHLTTGEQTFKIPGWAGVACVGLEHPSANHINVFCHVDEDKDEYLARFLLGCGEEGGIAPDNFIYAGSTRLGDYVYHVWRNAVTEKAAQALPRPDGQREQVP